MFGHEGGMYNVITVEETEEVIDVVVFVRTLKKSVLWRCSLFLHFILLVVHMFFASLRPAECWTYAMTHCFFSPLSEVSSLPPEAANQPQSPASQPAFRKACQPAARHPARQPAEDTQTLGTGTPRVPRNHPRAFRGHTAHRAPA